MPMVEKFVTEKIRKNNVLEIIRFSYSLKTKNENGIKMRLHASEIVNRI
jgi:hypothetical protein